MFVYDDIRGSVYVCVNSINVFSSQRRSKPSSSVAAAVREPVPE